MALKINPPAKKKITLNLDGEDGNAFNVMGAAVNVAKQIGWSKKEISEFRTKCFAGDYGNILTLVDTNFGTIIDLEMSEQYMMTIDSKAFRTHFLNDIVEAIE